MFIYITFSNMDPKIKQCLNYYSSHEWKFLEENCAFKWTDRISMLGGEDEMLLVHSLIRSTA